MSLEELYQGRRLDGQPFLCLEVNPPRGTEVEPIFTRLDGHLKGVDFLNVTDSALARMKMAALPFGSLLKAHTGVEVLVNFSCRDRNTIAIQSDLLAGWATGVRSIIALTGDAVTVGDAPETKAVFELNSVGLLKLIAKLNSGHDIVGQPIKGTPNFNLGVVVNPNARNGSAELKRLMRKREAGATYALSQPVFDAQAARAFFSEARAVGIPVLMGLMPMKSSAAAIGVAKVPGIRLCGSVEALLNRPPEEDISERFIAHCLNLATSTRDLVAGFHVISGATPKLGLVLMSELVRLFR